MTDKTFADVQDRYALWAEQVPDEAPDTTIWREAALSLSHDCETLTRALAAAHLDIERLTADRRYDRAAITRLLATNARLSRETPRWWETLGATVACGLDDLRAHWRHHARGLAALLVGVALVLAATFVAPGGR